MVVGDYTFVLKVTDTGGQTASSSLTVVVQPEKNAPPVAVAGSDKVCLVSLCSRFCFVVIFALLQILLQFYSKARYFLLAILSSVEYQFQNYARCQKPLNY